MRELVSLHNITKDTDIEALLDVLMDEENQFLADHAEADPKCTPAEGDLDPEQAGVQPSAEGETR